MKSWRRTLAIGFIIAITSQLYWNVFVNNFRVSASVILLPVLIMTVGSQIHTMTICTVTSIIVFLFRIVIYYLQGMPSEMLVRLAMPGAFFYIVYGMMFKLQIRNKHIANLENVIAAAFFCDLCSNIFENFLAALLKNNAMPGPDIIQKAFYDRCSPHTFCGTGTDRRTAVPASSYESGFMRAVISGYFL